MVILNRDNRSKFVKVRCPDCENEQVVFEKASSIINCLVCGSIVSKPTGGKAKISAEVIEIFE
jgi:small subunit ribosomal protein S27e